MSLCLGLKMEIKLRHLCPLDPHPQNLPRVHNNTFSFRTIHEQSLINVVLIFINALERNSSSQGHLICYNQERVICHQKWSNTSLTVGRSTVLVQGTSEHQPSFELDTHGRTGNGFESREQNREGSRYQEVQEFQEAEKF